MKKKLAKRLGLGMGCLLCVLLSAGLLGLLLLLPSGKSAPQAAKTIDIAQRFESGLQNRLSDAMSQISSVRKHYWIAEDASAPEPDGSAFGTAEDPAELAPLLEQAKDVLEGQTLYFSPENTQILPGSQIHYYYDETILAITWKEAANYSAVTYSEVKIMDPSQFRRYLAGGEFASGKLMLTTEMAETTNAVLACSGDFYGYRPDGVMVLDGVVRRANRGLPDICFVDKQGDLLLYRGYDFGSIQAAQDYVDEHDVRFSFSFGPLLIRDSQRCERYDYPIGELTQNYVRAALCQMDSLHYLFVTCNKEVGYPSVPDIGQFTALLLKTGCRQAYNLDGGQTATAVMDGQVINNVNYGSQRKISDIFYFATAKPSGG